MDIKDKNNNNFNTNTSRISIDSIIKSASSPGVHEDNIEKGKDLEVVEEASRQILEVGTSPYRSSQAVGKVVPDSQ